MHKVSGSRAFIPYTVLGGAIDPPTQGDTNVFASPCVGGSIANSSKILTSSGLLGFHSLIATRRHTEQQLAEENALAT